jgi:O-acetyl-ADP-ribose deacetylase (regulator of RNase III)
MKYIFFDNNSEIIETFMNEVNNYKFEYSELFKKCMFIEGDILDIIEDYNHYILVSPANSFGSMKGGIDKIINKYIFKNIEEKVMKKIEDEYKNNKFPYKYYFDGMNIKDRPYMDVGESFIIKANKNNYLAVVPTMNYPQIINDTNNAYIAMKSLLNTMQQNKDKINAKYVLIPGFCSGIGEMDAKMMTKQMLDALIEFYNYYSKN